LNDLVGIVGGLVAFGFGAIFVAIEHFTLAILCFALSGLTFVLFFIFSHRNWITRAGALLSGIVFLSVCYFIDQYRIKKEAEAFQQNLQSQSIQSDVHEVKKLLLENAGKVVSAPALNNFIDSRGFEKKYPLGFALFYADGSKTFHYGRLPNPDVSFDPGSIKAISITENAIQITGFEITVKKSHLKMNNFYINKEALTVKHLILINGVNVDAESLGISTEGAAWIIGLRPAE
jgi:uncharacterized membrane protein